jgi:hypothetical protein
MALPTRKVRGGVALEPLQVALPPITSVFTTADTFIEGTVIFVSQGGAECPSGKCRCSGGSGHRRGQDPEAKSSIATTCNTPTT